jgi:DNA-binding transcriptional ArsR family regulator
MIFMPKKSISKEVCQVICFNRNKVNKIKKVMPSQEKLNILVEIFKAISDNSRAKILLALRDGELCVCDISHILGLSLSAISHQLRILRNLRLVKYRNEGRMAFYSLVDKRIVRLIEEGMRDLK